MGAIKQEYGTAVSGTGGIHSLASSASFIAGYAWLIIDNTAEKAEDFFNDHVIRVGTTPTTNTEIRIYAFASFDGTAWPDGFSGAAGAKTWTSVGVRDGFAKQVGQALVDSTTSNRDYPIQFNLQSWYPTIPKKVALWVAHNTGVNLEATAGNQKYNISPVYRNAA